MDRPWIDVGHFVEARRHPGYSTRKPHVGSDRRHKKGACSCTIRCHPLVPIGRRHIKGIEEAFYKTFKQAQDVGELDGNTNIRDLARLYMGIAQGLALIGRVQDAPAVPRSIVSAALATLKTT